MPGFLSSSPGLYHCPDAFPSFLRGAQQASHVTKFPSDPTTFCTLSEHGTDLGGGLSLVPGSIRAAAIYAPCYLSDPAHSEPGFIPPNPREPPKGLGTGGRKQSWRMSIKQKVPGNLDPLND